MLPIIVINRDDAPERLVAIWADAERLGLALKRRAATGTPDDPLADHRAAWALIAGGEASHALVTGDDVALDDTLVPLLDISFLSEAMPNGGVVRLDGERDADADETLRLVRWHGGRPPRAYIMSREAARMLVDRGEDAGCDLGAALRSVSRSGAAALAVMPPPIVPPVDALPQARLGPLQRLREQALRLVSGPGIVVPLPAAPPRPADDPPRPDPSDGTQEEAAPARDDAPSEAILRADETDYDRGAGTRASGAPRSNISA